ncbi:LacI family DNA-binding transcriptional regulator [Affinibrenneria salicis]|uniref:LacI family DNA-binding transcriptional regulator n=1 Tax=Affinibrenneria salicis TaxID=2590031 RepID=A0A5J5FY17_9GAMM|nr:LacI family DNA-binding transcriptional regulator [Affinibrenneria salicis]KAA8999006.1 LacI family DNA-binding transcriptional regulator [Affinibrenneria salicis]
MKAKNAQQKYGKTRSPTLEDVAREAGLSPMTVSRALNNPHLVRATTVEKVKKAIAVTGYIPNLLAGGLASRRSKLIAVVVPQINNNMFVDTVQAISDQLAKRGYHMLLCVSGYTEDKESEIVSAILSRRPDGIVLTGIQHSPQMKRIILSSELPVVEIWDLTPTPLDMLVGFSHEKIGNKIAKYLYKKGYRKFGLIWTEDKRAVVRKKGITDTLAKNKVKPLAEATVPLPATLSLGREGLCHLLDSGNKPDAVICSSDTLAQGAIIEASHRGLRVPQDIAIMGFGDLDFSRHNVPSISTVKIDRWRIGIDAANMLADKIEGAELNDVVIDIGFELIEREST